VLARWKRRALVAVVPGGEYDDHELVRKGALTAILVPAVYLMDWLLVGATVGIYAWLRHLGLGDVGIWLTLWAGNILLSGAVVLGGDRLGVDITLMETVRRLVDASLRRSWLIGTLVEAALVGRLLIWDGPDQFIIFFRRRLPWQWLRGAVFVAASGFQMYVWGKIYSLGYDGIGNLVRGWGT
jgi:hypothetical protein